MNKPTIEIHIITYNEEIMLPFTITHYRRMFGDPKFVVHDNCSTDDTVMLAHLAGATVIPFVTDGLSDSAYTKIKSEAHLTAEADWCLCVDCDEHCYITTEDLQELSNKGINIVTFKGWDVFADVEHPSFIKEPKGCYSPGYSKSMLVKTKVFSELLYGAGCHNIQKLIPNKENAINYSTGEYNLLHYKHWNIDHVVSRSAMFAQRLSEENKKNGWGFHYNFPAQAHIDYFVIGINTAKLIIDKRIQYDN